MFNHSTNSKEIDVTAPKNHEQKQKPAQEASSKACVLFELGAVVGTPAAIWVLKEARVSFMTLIARHVQGDWGNVCPDDAQSNLEAIRDGGRILSSYDLTAGTVWVITEADRSVTTVLLPSDY